MLKLHWKRLGSAGFVNDFQPIYNNYGWADYITKEITATNESIPFLVEILTCPSRPHWPTFVVDRRHS